VEGFILIDTVMEHSIKLPVVSVAGHSKIAGITDVVLDQRRAAELTLRHLFNWGTQNCLHCAGTAAAPTPTTAGSV